MLLYSVEQAGTVSYEYLLAMKWYFGMLQRVFNFVRTYTQFSGGPGLDRPVCYIWLVSEYWVDYCHLINLAAFDGWKHLIYHLIFKNLQFIWLNVFLCLIVSKLITILLSVKNDTVMMAYIFILDSALPTNTNCRNQSAYFQPDDYYRLCNDILHLRKIWLFWFLLEAM